MESSALVIAGCLTVVFDKGLYVIDALSEKNVFIPVLEEGKNLSFLNEGERGWNGNIPKHFELR